MSNKRRMDKENVVYVCLYTYIYIYIEYYSALKNEILPFVATWTDLNDITK